MLIQSYLQTDSWGSIFNEGLMLTQDGGFITVFAQRGGGHVAGR